MRLLQALVRLPARLLFAASCVSVVCAPAPATAAGNAAAAAFAAAGETAARPSLDPPAAGPLAQAGQADQGRPPRQVRQTVRPPVPASCVNTKGVERKICVECDGVAVFKRIGCQQRVFWTTCKGRRLFEDSYCQTHQDQGPPRGEGG